jgi:hypothetical protein
MEVRIHILIKVYFQGRSSLIDCIINKFENLAIFHTIYGSVNAMKSSASTSLIDEIKENKLPPPEVVVLGQP